MVHDIVNFADPGNPSYRAKLYEALEGYRVEALPWAQARVRLYQAMKRLGLGGATVARPTPPLRKPEQCTLFE